MKKKEALKIEHQTVLDHQLLTGKCEAILPEIDTHSIDCIVTDPPYGINKDYGGDPDKTRPALKIWQQLFRILTKKGSLHMTTSNRHMPFWIDTLRLAGFKYRHCSVYWNTKRKGGNMNGMFSYCWEPILHFTKTTFKCRKRMFFDIYPHNGMKFTGHPAERNLWAWVDMMDHLPDGLILDPFAGVGTTGVAAEIVGGQKTVLIDSNPKFIRIAGRRLNAIGGELYDHPGERDEKYPTLDSMPPDLKDRLSRYHPDLLYKNKKPGKYKP